MDSINGMDGEIRSVAIRAANTMPSTTISLYIGGNFSTVRKGGIPSTRYGIAKFTCTQSLIPALPPGNFSLSNWDADLEMLPLQAGPYSDGVNDILFINDTVIFCGRFGEVNDSSTPLTRDGIAAYSIGGTLLNYPAFSSDTYYENSFYHLEKKGPNLFIGGAMNNLGYNTGELIKLDISGNIISSFNLPFSEIITCVFDFTLFEDSLIIVAADYNAETYQPEMILVCRQSNGSFKTDHALFNNGTLAGLSGFSSLAKQNQTIFLTSGNFGNYLLSFESELGAGPPITPAWNTYVNANLASSPYGKIHVAGNKLFVSAPNLTTLSSQSKLRLGAFCIEPNKALPFITYDTTICPETSITYTIPPVAFADGYKWEYTGVGAFKDSVIEMTGPIELSGANSINIVYTFPFSPGQLKVTPYTLCNNTTKIYGNTISLNIDLNPLPHINSGPDRVLTCTDDTLALFGYSDSAVVSYMWIYPSALDNVAGQYDTIEASGNYVFKVVNALGCPNYDTLTVSENTVQPIATLPLPPYELTCFNPVMDFLGSSTSPNTISEWYQDSTTFFPNPISVNTIGTYYFRVTDTLNGCFKDTGIVVSNNITPPSIGIMGYPTIGLTLETLTCDLDSLNLTCYSSTPNSTTDWINPDTTIFYGDHIIITDGGFYHLFATNNSNGCTNTLNVFIAEDFSLHGITTPPDGLLNCSTDSLVLAGSSLSAGAILEWNGSTISASSNPVTVFDPGWYYLSAVNLNNGCTMLDSVLVSQDNSITVFAGNDTLVCANAAVPVNATYVGTISGINYLWSNGATNANTNFTAGTQPYAIVQITGDGGCIGTDTVYLNLPPTPVVNFEGFKPCDDGPSGQIVATPVSGIEPFTYSIDNGLNYQSSSVFSGLYIGDYPIIVRDSVNCDYNFTATIDENSSLPSPAFLFSTYNFETDTVVIIDVSNPPTDSTFWLFPSELIVLDNNPLSPMILLPDTGTFQITMQAYYGNCLVELSKLIYASPYDSLAATQYNLNGIKSIELYPNPTTGNFTVEVEFYKSQRAALVVQDMLANTYVFEEYDESFIITQDVYLDGTVIDGTYVLKIVSEFDSASITFILAR